MMRNPDAKHLDFEDLIGVIPENPKLLPSNVDMMLERSGKFLVGEWKRPHEKISLGQEILLKALARQQNFIVLLITGDTDEGMYIEKFERLRADGSYEIKGKNASEFKQWLVKWYGWVNKHDF